MLTIEVGDDDQLDLVYGALANRRRRRVVLALSLRPASIAQLAAQQGLSLPAFHRHVVALEDAGLVERRKSGRVTFLALTRSGLGAAQGWLGQFHSYWGAAGETLENYVAGIAAAEPDHDDPPTKGSDQ